MENDFLKATCQINNRVVGKVCSLLSVMGAQGWKLCHLWAFGKNFLWSWTESFKISTGKSFYEAVYFRGLFQNWFQLSCASSIFILSLFQTFVSLRCYFRHSLVRTLSALIPSRKEFRKVFFYCMVCGSQRLCPKHFFFFFKWMQHYLNAKIFFYYLTK